MQLTNGAATITLPDDLAWVDEYAWQAVEQSVERSVTGAQIIDVGIKTKGRPITLSAGADFAHITRSVLDQLMAWANLPPQTMTLTLVDGRSFQVMFRHHDGGGVTAEALIHIWPVQPDDYYIPTLRLMEI